MAEASLADPFSVQWLRTGSGDNALLRRLAANRRRADALIDALDRTVDQSAAVLAVREPAADDSDMPMRVVARRRLARNHRTRSEHVDRAAAVLEAHGEHDRAAFERERAALLRGLAEHLERRAAYEEAHRPCSPPPGGAAKLGVDRRDDTVEPPPGATRAGFRSLLRISTDFGDGASWDR